VRRVQAGGALEAAHRVREVPALHVRGALRKQLVKRGLLGARCESQAIPATGVLPQRRQEQTGVAARQEQTGAAANREEG
jgi:hypothetical protein